MERKNTIAFQLQINSNTNTSTNPTVMTETEFSHSCVVCMLNPAALCNLTFNSSQWLLRQQWKYLLTKRWLANTQFSTNKASWEFCAHLHRLTTNPGVHCHFLSASAFSFVMLMLFHDIIYLRAHTSSFLIEIKVQLRWRWILKEQLVKFSSASRKLDSCWLFEKGQGTSIALRNGVSVLMNTMTLNNGAGSVIFTDNIQSEWTPLCVDVKEISMPVIELTLVLLKAL